MDDNIKTAEELQTMQCGGRAFKTNLLILAYDLTEQSNTNHREREKDG